MNWELHIENLKKGEVVSFRPKGNSMQPKIESGDLVTISPEISDVSEGDAVFCKVKGIYYVHLVKAEKSEGSKELFLIGNNKGGTNGWISKNMIFGKVIDISP
jgi:phage repressor protein C with HTH and peptisase S24 domain